MSKERASVLDGLINLVLVAVGLTVLVAIVIVCLPKKGSLAKGWQQAWAQMTKKVDSRKEWNLAQEKLPEVNVSRPTVSYNDPGVRRTINVPWR